MTLKIEFDGASRGNPGPASYGYRITQSEMPLEEDSGYIGETTNNIAEYTALVKALETVAKEYPTEDVEIIGDSQLIIKQMKGEYGVNSEKLAPLHKRARNLIGQIVGDVELKHTKRDNNERADELANEALDRQEKDQETIDRERIKLMIDTASEEKLEEIDKILNK